MNWFHNISIRYKLLLSFGLTVVFAGAIAGIGYFNIHAMSEQAHTIQADRLVPVMELGAAEAALFEIALIGRDLAAGEEERQFSDALEKHEHIFEASLDTVGMTNLDAEGRAKLKDVQTAWAAFKPHVDRAREALTSEAADIDRAQARAFTDEAHTLIAHLESMKEHEVALAEASDQMITSAERTAMVELFGGSGLILVVSIGVALFVARVISNPVRELKAAAQQVSEGNLQVETDIRSKDELGQLSTSFNGMVESIRTSVHEAEEQSRKAEEIAQEAREARAEAQEQQKALRRNVQYILEKMNRLADGDLTVQTEVAGREGAIRELFIGFNEVVATIRDMLIRVDEAVETTSSAAGQISGASTQLAAASEEQSAQADEGRRDGGDEPHHRGQRGRGDPHGQHRQRERRHGARKRESHPTDRRKDARD